MVMVMFASIVGSLCLTSTSNLGTVAKNGTLVGAGWGIYDPPWEGNTFISAYSIELTVNNVTLTRSEITTASLAIAIIGGDTLFLANENTLGDASYSFPSGVGASVGFEPYVGIIADLEVDPSLAGENITAVVSFGYIRSQATPAFMLNVSANHFQPFILTGAGGTTVVSDTFALSRNAHLISGQALFSNQAINMQVIDPTTKAVLCESTPVLQGNEIVQTTFCDQKTPTPLRKGVDYQVVASFNNQIKEVARADMQLFLEYNNN